MIIQEMLAQVRNLDSGDYAECGVYQGMSAEIIAASKHQDSFLYLFDTFKGHIGHGEFDHETSHPDGNYSDTSLEQVKERLKAFPNVIIISGDIRKGILNVLDGRKFRFVNVDVDLYEPTYAAIKFFKSHMVSGGIMRLDDYRIDDCPGATKAADELLEEINFVGHQVSWWTA